MESEQITEKSNFELFDALSDMIFILDNEFRFVKVNKATCDILKKEKKDLIGKKCHEIVHCTNEPWPNCPFKKTLETKTKVTEEVNDSNLGISLLITTSPLFDSNNKITGCIHIAKDITEMKKSEEKLKESEERFKQFFENNVNYCYMISPEGTILNVNKSALKTLGYQKEELIGKLLLPTIYSPSSQERAKQLFLKWKESGKLENIEMEIITKNRKKRIVLLNVDMVKDNQGNIIHSISVQTDITEKKKAEQALKESEGSLKMAQKIAHIGSYGWDINTGDVIWSDGMYRVFGVSPEKFGRTITFEQVIKLIHPDDISKVEEYTQRVLKETTKDSIEYRVLHPNGVIRILSGDSGIVSIDKNGKPVKLIGTVRDITEKKKAEEALKESEGRLSEAAKIAHMGYLDWDITKNEIKWSDETYSIYGFDPRKTEATFELTIKGVHPDDLVFVKENLDKVVNGTLNQYNIEHRIIRPNGEVRYVYAQGHPVRNKNGMAIKMLGTIIDITEKKKAEQEIKQLNTQLQKYSKQLEHKVRVLENGKIPLTDKEKLVLYGLCTDPLTNDEKLAQKLNLKRSTVTSIKNRLRQREWFKIINIPNFYALGCEMFSIINSNFNTILKERRELGIIDEIKNQSEIIFDYETDNRSISLFTAQKYPHLQRYIENSSILKQGVLKKEINPVNFFYDLDLVELFDYSALLNNLFELKTDFTDEKPGFKLDKNEKCSLNNLNHNERRVFSALIKYPELSVAKIAKKIWKSKPTVSKIKKKLIENGYIFPLVIPDLRKLVFSLFAIVSFNVDQQTAKKTQKLEYQMKREPQTMMKIMGNKKITRAMIFRNYEEYETELKKLKDTYEKNNIEFKLETTAFPLQNKQLFEKVDFASLTDKLLFPEEN